MSEANAFGEPHSFAGGSDFVHVKKVVIRVAC
jgi:hypothetical protein